MAGYRDWHDLANSVGRGPKVTPDAFGQEDQLRPDAASLTIELSDRLGLSVGDGLYALAEMRLPGIRIEDLELYEAIWLRLFRETQPFGTANARLAQW